MHFSDQNMVSRVGTSQLSHTAMRFQMHMPAAGNMHRLQRLTEMSLWLVDKLATDVTLSSHAMARARRARAAADAEFSRQKHAERTERVATRRMEARKKESEEYEGLSTEKKRARDAADEKRRTARMSRKLRR